MSAEVERSRKGGIVLESSVASEEKAGRWSVLPLQWGWKDGVRNRTLETEKKNQKFKRNATGVDKNRILETELGYECHPETDQSTIARERLEERLPNRKIYIQVRGATCTECIRKARKQIQSGFGTHITDALETGATSFCGEDRVLHRLRRQHARFAASEYVLYCTPCAILGHCRPSFLFLRLRSGLGGII
jgi:hypothetical protein